MPASNPNPSPVGTTAIHSSAPSTSAPSAERKSLLDLTQVELTWDEGKIERWIRFGHPVDNRIIDHQRCVLSFAPNSVIAFVRWQSNAFGTVLSRIDILRTRLPQKAMTGIGYVRPGGEILLRMSGWPKVQHVLQLIDAIEQAGFDPADICPDHWRHIHNRLCANQEPRDYTNERHTIWLARKALLS